MITFIDAILTLYPDANLIIENDDYDNIQWFDPVPDPIPTREQIESSMRDLQEFHDKTEYRRQRAAEYPPLADLADALYWQSQGDDSKMTEYLTNISTIKNKYPKGII